MRGHHWCARISLRASSPILASEGSRARTHERAAKPRGAAPRFLVSSRVPLGSRVYFSRYPQMENLLACYVRINCTPKSYILICCGLGNLWMESNSLSLDVMSRCWSVMWPRSNREPCGYIFEERILVSVQQRNKYDFFFPVVERNWIRKQNSIIIMLQILRRGRLQ